MIVLWLIHDINQGTNGKYNAHKGWDAVTRLGSPDLYKLAQEAAILDSTVGGLDGIATVSGTNVWTVGFNGDPEGSTNTLIKQWNGRSWNVVPSPTPGSSGCLVSVAAVSANDVWAVGYYYDSNNDDIHSDRAMEWQQLECDTQSQSWSNVNYLSSVAAVSANDVWAVGNMRIPMGTTIP